MTPVLDRFQSLHAVDFAAIAATVLSTVTYLSTPGEMIKNGVGANAQFLSYPLVFFLVSYLILPYLMRLRLTTAYEYLTLILSLCGIALYSYYQAAIPDDPDLVFPHFIRHILPRGLAGLVAAAAGAAAVLGPVPAKRS